MNMIKNLNLFVFFTLLLGIKGYTQLQTQTIRTSELGCAVWVPSTYNPNIPIPLVIFAHGVGQKVGRPPTQDTSAIYTDGMPQALRNGYVPSYSFIMIAPQDSDYSVNPNVVINIIHEAKLRWNIDPQRIHLVSFSGGGQMSQGLLTNWDTSTAKLIASVVSVAGVCTPPRVNTDTASLGKIRVSRVPLLEIIGDSDNVIGYQNEVNFMNGLNNALPGVATLITEHGVGHTDFGIFNNTWGGINIYDWLQQHPLGSYNVGNALVITANAGTDQNITLPTNSATLQGTGASNKGPITSYTWVKVSGPSGDTITCPNCQMTQIRGLVQGTYTYQLVVQDSLANTANDNMTVIVNPVAGSQPTIKTEAEAFTAGSNKTGQQTADGGIIIGMTANATTPSWLDFTVTITSAGTYPTSFRMGSPLKFGEEVTNTWYMVE
jgi:predicted esterase